MLIMCSSIVLMIALFGWCKLDLRVPVRFEQALKALTEADAVYTQHSGR